MTASDIDAAVELFRVVPQAESRKVDGEWVDADRSEALSNSGKDVVEFTNK